MSEILITGGRVVDPANGIDEVTDLLIKNGKIAKLGKGLSGNGNGNGKTINASGMVVSPGFIDLHVHFREPGQEYKEDITSGAKSGAAGGYSTVCAMANTNPVNDNGTITAMMVAASKKAASCRVLPIGAVTKGLNGTELAEIAEMFHAGAVALSDDGRCVNDPAMIRKGMEYGSMFNMVVVEHCEDCSAAGGVINEGKTSTVLGLRGMPATAESTIGKRDAMIAEYIGLPVHLAHISVAEVVHAVRDAKSRGVKVTCEVTPHHFTLSEDDINGFDSNYKMSPPLRTKADIEEIKRGMADGTVDCIATDHAPHATYEKEQELDLAPFGIVGLETALPLSLRLVDEGVITLGQMIAMLTHRAAEVFGLPYGTLSEGAAADVAIFNENETWVVEPEKFLSKGRNTPFAGEEMKGKNLLTIVDGKIVYNPAKL